MNECPLKNYAKCTAYAMRKALASRATPRPKDLVGACKGIQRLNKKAFLSMVGANKYTPPVGSVVSADLLKLEEIRQTLSENGGDFVAAARSLGTVPSRLKMKYNLLLSREIATTVEGDPYSSTPERRFYEKLTRPWSITSFDPRKGEVCVEIDAGPSIAHLSSTVPTYRT